MTPDIEKNLTELGQALGSDESIVKNVMSRIESEKIESPQPNHNVWRIIMKSKMIKFAAAAVIVIAVLVGINRFGGTIDGSSVSWAEVVKQIKDFRPYKCKEIIYYSDKKPFSRINMYLSLSQRREERENGQIFIVDMRLCPVRTLLLDNNQKIAGLTVDYNIGPRNDPDWLRILVEMKNSKSEELGMQEINGIKAKGFRKIDEYNNITIWADIKTGLPLKLEVIHPQDNQKFVFEDFVFDVTFDDKIFSTQPPEGYQLYETTNDKTADKDKTYKIQSAEGPKQFIPYSCIETVYRGDKLISCSKLYEPSLSQLRLEDETHDVITIQDKSACPMKTLTLYPKSKKATLSVDYRFGPAEQPNILEMLTAMKKYNSEKLGVREIEGVQAEGFRRRDPFNDIAIWADLKTGLPVKFEVTHTKPDQKIVDANFDFNVKFDPTLFSTQAPTDYEVNETIIGQEKVNGNMRDPNQKKI
jgi:outer membrane lipoprotein-sorting protein